MCLRGLHRGTAHLRGLITVHCQVRNERLSSDNCRRKGYIPGPSSHPFHVPVKHLVSQALVVRGLEGRVLWATDRVDHRLPGRVACTAWAGGGGRRGSRAIMLLPGLQLSSKAGAAWSTSEWAEPFIHGPIQDMPAGDPTPQLCRDMRCLLTGQAAWPGRHTAALLSAHATYPAEPPEESCPRVRPSSSEPAPSPPARGSMGWRPEPTPALCTHPNGQTRTGRRPLLLTSLPCQARVGNVL